LEIEHGNGSVVVRTVGEIDVETAPLLRDCLMALYRDGHRSVVLDLADLDFIDSTGIGVMVAGAKRLRGDGGDLVIRSPRPPVQKVLQLTGLDRVFTTD
jgi:anti-sigma B factor antagonist